MTVEYLLAFAVLLYLLQVTRSTLALSRLRDEISQEASPFVSVVIAARNEEGNIAECLTSVLHQSYPSEKYEIVVVNDHSSDGTERICLEFAAAHPQVVYLNARHDELLRGKTNALDQGIERARGEIILVTDADCTVPTTWVEWTARRYGEQVGVVGGITVQKASTPFEGMQSVDWAYVLGLAASAVAYRDPLSTIGNNLSFRKAAYQEIGGYRKIPFSVTEDFMLFRSILRTTKWRCLYPIDPRVLVVSQPCSTFRELIRQKHRWGKGGLDMKLSGMTIMATGFGTHALILGTMIFGSVFFAATCLMLKFAADYIFLHAVLKRLERTDLLKFFYWFELYFILYVFILPFVVFFGGKVIWKQRSY
jgi:cellulose synthase/poly-beta-1,6-N-acetylglucosamine synthase-like glycosyltransferase